MSWVDPEFTCGECGGTIARWPMKNMLKQDILDWRHKTVPAGVTEHRAVLGTPVPIQAVIAPTETPVELDVPVDAPSPITPARPAMREELPASALRLDKKAEENGWIVQAFYMAGPLMDARWRFNRWVQSVVLWLDRDGHRLVASWQAKWDPVEVPEYKFEQAYSLTHDVQPLTSPELNAAVVVPRAICESCGEPPALHVRTSTGPVCYCER